MRLFAAISLLLFVLVALVGGQALIFQLYRTKIRMEAKSVTRKMSEKDGIRLRFSKKEISIKLPFQIVEQDEIIMGDEFYDIKSFRETEDSLILIAYKDTDEKKLVASFSRKLHERNNENWMKNIISEVISWIYILPEHSHQICFTGQTTTRFSIHLQQQRPVYLKTLSPPPENTLS